MAELVEAERKVAIYKQNGLDQMNPAFFQSQQDNIARLVDLVGPKAPVIEQESPSQIATKQLENTPSLVAKALVEAEKQKKAQGISQVDPDAIVRGTMANVEATRDSNAGLEALTAEMQKQTRLLEQVNQNQQTNNTIQQKNLRVAQSKQ